MDIDPTDVWLEYPDGTRVHPREVRRMRPLPTDREDAERWQAVFPHPQPYEARLRHCHSLGQDRLILLDAITETEDVRTVEHPAVLLPPMTWTKLPTDPVVWLYVDTMSSTAVRYQVGDR